MKTKYSVHIVKLLTTIYLLVNLKSFQQIFYFSEHITSSKNHIHIVDQEDLDFLISLSSLLQFDDMINNTLN